MAFFKHKQQFISVWEVPEGSRSEILDAWNGGTLVRGDLYAYMTVNQIEPEDWPLDFHNGCLDHDISELIEGYIDSLNFCVATRKIAIMQCLIKKWKLKF